MDAVVERLPHRPAHVEHRDDRPRIGRDEGVTSVDVVDGDVADVDGDARGGGDDLGGGFPALHPADPGDDV
ncbi:hypothetical protein, partial [Miniimonas arenae]|uniref:hypothetical protein n=1 Tax=Miniimonas arenae TaxID=676201 RepID=UPI0028AC26D5